MEDFGSFELNAMTWLFLGLALGVVVVVASRRLRKPTESVPRPIRPEAVPLPVELPVVAEVSKPDEAFELVYGPTASAPALVIGSWGKQPIPGNARALNAKSSGLLSLAPLAQAVPSLLTAAEFGSNNYMRVVVNGPLAAAKDGGFFPFVRGPDGKIAEMANLQVPSDMGTWINAAAVWQIASVIVAQKHLADINRKLDEIKSAIEAVHQHQKDSRRSKVSGGIEYLRELTELIRRGEMPMASRVEIEAFLRDLLTIQDHVQKDIQSSIEQIQGIQGNDWVGTGDLFEKLSRHEKGLTELLDEWAQCVDARILTWFVLTSFAGEHQQKEVRIYQIRRTIEAFVTNTDGLGELMAHWNKKLASISATFNTNTELDTRRAHIRTQVELTRSRLENATMKLHQSIETGASMLLEADQPITLAIRIDQSGEMQAYEIPVRNAALPLAA